MTWFNKQIAKVAPGYALKREIAQRRLDRLDNMKGKSRSFESVSGSRARYDILSTNKSADAALSGNEKLRHHVRQLEYNNGFISGPILRIVNNVVGLGFRFQSNLKADQDGLIYDFPKITTKDAIRFNAESEKWFNVWAEKADKRLLLTFDGILRLIEGALIRDGAVLCIGRNSKRKDRIIPYCLEVLEIDRMVTPMEEIRNPSIRNGIEYDGEGVPKLYYVLKTHPGESLSLDRISANSIEEIPAYNDNGTKKVIHLFNPLRPEQTIGFSQFASALKDYQDLDRYREAEILAALEAACLTGFVKTPDAATFQAERTVDYANELDGEGNLRRIHEFSPNEWHYLNPGEEVDVFHPERPNVQFGDFVDQLLRGPSNALDMPPELLSQNWKNMNYSNARTVLLQWYQSCKIRQKFLIDYCCAPIHANVLGQLIVKGKIMARGFDRRTRDFLSHSWIPRTGWQWVDPVKEANGKKIEVENSFETLTDICASKGKDLDEHLGTIAKERRKIKDLEEEYDIEFPKKQGTSNQGMNEEIVSEGNKSAKLKAVK